MSLVDILVKPIARACSLPSANTPTMVLAGKLSSILAPLLVNPGHIIFAPDKILFTAPSSTCTFGKASGSILLITKERYYYFRQNKVNLQLCFNFNYIYEVTLKLDSKTHQNVEKIR